MGWTLVRLFQLVASFFLLVVAPVRARAESGWVGVEETFRLPSGEFCGPESDELRDFGPGNCETMRHVQGIFNHLLSVAGVEKDEIQLFVLSPQLEFMSLYVTYSRSIPLSDQFMRKYGANDSSLAFQLAHEMAHYLQQIGGLMEPDRGYSRQQLEVQADLVGAQWYARAGYPLKDFMGLFEEFYTCELIRSGKLYHNGETQSFHRGMATGHPLAQDRWVNVLAAKSIVETLAPGLDQPFRMVVSPEVFDVQGRLLLSKLPDSIQSSLSPAVVDALSDPEAGRRLAERSCGADPLSAPIVSRR